MDIYSLIGLRPEQINAFWKEAEPWIAQALKKGKVPLTTEDILHRLTMGDSVLFVLLCRGEVHGAATVSIMQTEEGKVALIEQLGGIGLEAFQDHWSSFQTWARNRGAQAVQIRGRMGWLKKLQSSFETKYICMEHKL